MTAIKLPPDAPAGLRCVRDGDGVPHIIAPDVNTAVWGMGFCHAVDRPMQMVLMRILGQGRAAECLDGSDEMVEVDTFFRRMNWRGHMAEEVAALSAESRAICDAYCAGVNARLMRKRPFEYALVGHRPEPWTVEHTILLSRMTGYLTLAQSQAEMERLLVEMVQAGVDDARIAALFPPRPAWLDRALLEKVKLVERVVPEALKWLSPAPRMMASNNWAVAAERSASGHALLANDPHLEINRLPNVWVEQVVELPDDTICCFNMAGLPGPVVGRNRHLAWGATYTFMDAVDHWVEDCRDGCHRRGDDWVPFEVRTEVIERRKGAPVTVTFYENGHGVLDGDPHAAGLYLSSAWSTGRSGARSLDALTRMWRARTVDDGMGGVGHIETAWNWVFADSAGRIGYQMSGLMPKRHPEADGAWPMPGWDPAYDWQGFVAPEALPRCVDPEAGYIVTANQDLNHLGVADPINLPMGDYRARRIAERLDAIPKASFDDFDAMHMDAESLQAKAFMDHLRPLLPETAFGRALAGWDLRYDPASVGAVAFEALYRALIEEVFGGGLGGPVVEHLLDATGVFIDFYQNFDRVLLAESSPWFAGRDREAVYRAALERCPETVDGTWGAHNAFTFTNIFFGGKLPGFLGFDRGPYPLRGGRATPHQGQLYRSGDRLTSFAPSMRLMADMGESTLRTALAGGPSDRRFSKWYASGIDDWLAGRYAIRGRISEEGS